MSLLQGTKFPSLTQSHRQSYNCSPHETAQSSEEGQDGENAATDQPASRKLCRKGNSYLYAGPGRKPQFLMQLESYVNKELQTLSSNESNFQELKLQIYRDVFGRFINEFKTYQPLLSAIKKQYDKTLAFQKDQIRELEPLQSHLRLVTEECDRKILAHWEDEQVEVGVLKREKQLLQKDLEAMQKKEKALQELVDHLQGELSNQYLQYREEHDARKLLIWQLNNLSKSPVEENPTDPNGETQDLLELQLALKVCREDLSKSQVDLISIKARYLDVVPRCDWDSLKQVHTQTLMQLKTLQGDFDQLKNEYEILLEIHKGVRMQNERQDPISEQGEPERTNPSEVTQGNMRTHGLDSEQTRLQK